MGQSQNHKKILICDLDGTLIDSSPGILRSIEKACNSCDVVPAVPIQRSLVGPPLNEMLKLVLGSDDIKKLPTMKDYFIQFYDEGECTLAPAFPGVEDMLNAVRKAGHTLALATNKRLRPTKKILEAKGWVGHFRFVETSDSSPAGHQSKANMIKSILSEWSRSSGAFFLGDTELDFLAAQEAAIPCLIVDWGYNPQNFGGMCKTIREPGEIIPILSNE